MSRQPLNLLSIPLANLDQCLRWPHDCQELFSSKNQLAPSQTNDTVLNWATVNGETGSVRLPPSSKVSPPAPACRVIRAPTPLTGIVLIGIVPVTCANGTVIGTASVAAALAVRPLSVLPCKITGIFDGLKPSNAAMSVELFAKGSAPIIMPVGLLPPHAMPWRSHCLILTPVEKTVFAPVMTRPSMTVALSPTISPAELLSAATNFFGPKRLTKDYDKTHGGSSYSSELAS